MTLPLLVESMIRPDEIDPAIQAALKERFSQIFAQNTALDPVTARVKSAGLKAWRDTAKRYSAHYRGAAALFATSLLSLPIMAPINEELWSLVFVALNAVAIGLTISAGRKVQRDLTRYVNPGVMRGASHLVALSRAEQLYCEAIAALIDAGSILGEVPRKEILVQLNELLASHRKLDETLKHHRAGSASGSLEEVEKELETLTRKRDGLADAGARATAEQSIELCRRRLEVALRFAPVSEQAQAQQDLIIQTLASLQASLARIAGAGATPPSAEVVGLRESVDQVNRQTRAVEEAVTEVMTLGAVR